MSSAVCLFRLTEGSQHVSLGRLANLPCSSLSLDQSLWAFICYILEHRCSNLRGSLSTFISLRQILDNFRIQFLLTGNISHPEKPILFLTPLYPVLLLGPDGRSPFPQPWNLVQPTHLLRPPAVATFCFR